MKKPLKWDVLENKSVNGAERKTGKTWFKQATKNFFKVKQTRKYRNKTHSKVKQIVVHPLMKKIGTGKVTNLNLWFGIVWTDNPAQHIIKDVL